MRVFVRAAIAVLAIAAPFTARVHAFDVWLTPNAFFLTSFDFGSTILAQGDTFPTATVPMPADQIDQILMVDPRGTRSTNQQWNLRPEVLKHLAFDYRLPRKQPGTAIVAASSKPAYASVGATAFTGYLRSTHLDAIVAERQRRGESTRSGRERFTVHPKTLVRVGRVPQKALSQATRAVGAPLLIEVVPDRDPYLLKAGGKLPVQVLFRGAPLPDAPIVATYATYRGQPGEYAWSGRTDASGRATIPMAVAGQWFVRVVNMVRLDHDPQADWESFWGSLTFELR